MSEVLLKSLTCLIMAVADKIVVNFAIDKSTVLSNVIFKIARVEIKKCRIVWASELYLLHLAERLASHHSL